MRTKTLAAVAAVLTVGIGAAAAGLAGATSARTPAPTAPALAAPATSSTTSTTSTTTTPAVAPGASLVAEPAPGEVADPRPEGPAPAIRDRVDVPTPGPRPGTDDPARPIGGIDPSGRVPAGLDLAAFPDAPARGTGTRNPALGGGPGSLSAGPGCAYQCIASGVAYPRGFGAELVVETTVPADLFLSVIADMDGDGDWEFEEFRWSEGKVTTQSWVFDHLAPGQTYHAMVTATDEHHDTSYAWGQFTTLSTRTAHLVVTDVEVIGGPTNLESTGHHLRLDDDPHAGYEPGDWASFEDVARHVDVDLLVSRFWEAQVCEPFWAELMAQPQGDSDDSCLSWNTASDEVDLDVVPAGKTRWMSNTFQVTLRTPSGDGDALPPGYGDPRWFDVVAVASVVVAYS